MTTTAVFAEILVVGLQAAAWIALAVLAVFGPSSVDFGGVDEWATLVTILVLAAAYVLGILIDRIADSFVPAVLKGDRRSRFAKWVKRLWTKSNGADERPNENEFQRKRMKILRDGSEATVKFLDYQRSRLRVARGTIVNSLCAIPALVAFLARQTEASAAWLVGASVAGFVVVAAAVYANEKIHSAYEANFNHAYKFLRD